MGCDVKCPVDAQDNSNVDFNKPYVGQLVFDPKQSLKYFTQRDILSKIFPSKVVLNYYSSDRNLPQVISQIHNVKLLFYLMSTAAEDTAQQCLKTMNRMYPSWSIRVNDVIQVFLNWGATFSSLGCKEEAQNPDIKDVFEIMDESNPGQPNAGVPSEATVKIVLAAIRQHQPTEDDDFSFEQKRILVRILTYAAFDKNQKRNKLEFLRTIDSVLESIPSWDNEKASLVANSVLVDEMELQNGAYACCCIFNETSERLNDVGTHLCHVELCKRFHLPTEERFPSLIVCLPPAVKIVQSFHLTEMFIMVQLLNSLLSRYSDRNPPIPVILLDQLHKWALALHELLKAPRLLMNLESGYVRERLIRLAIDCSNILHARRGPHCVVMEKDDDEISR